MNSKPIRVGSRESALALAQANLIINQIKEKHPEAEFEVVGIKTKGDAILDTRLDKLGGKGLFIKELENALLEGVIDMAVHSLKDMPAEIPDGLEISAYSKREDPRDVLVTSDGRALEELHEGAVIGTSSLRREVQLRYIRPDLKFKTLRGNVLTRLEKLARSDYDAIVLAAAGLKRLGLEKECTQYFDTGKLIPAVGQGILAVETRKGRSIQYLLDCVNCENAAHAALAERAFMRKLNGGCSIPLAAHATLQGGKIELFGMFAPDGKPLIYKEFVEGNKEDSVLLGEKLAEIIIQRMT